MYQTHTVSIGRNVGSEPMLLQDWWSFTESLKVIVNRTADQVFFAGRGQGQFEGEDEESFTIVFGGALTNAESRHLDRSLAELARRFNQHSIAWTTGDTRLVPARTYASVPDVDGRDVA